MLEQKAEMPGIQVKGIKDLVNEVLDKEAEAAKSIKEEQERFDTSLEGQIVNAYTTNKNAREEADIEVEMLKCLYQVNMQYTAEELSAIKGSNIYMGITSTKHRAAASWIKDLIMPANGFPVAFRPSESPDIPPEIRKKVEEAFKEDEQKLIAEIKERNNPQPQQPQQPQPGQPQQPPEKPSAISMSRQLREIAELKRDVDEAIRGEIDKIALDECKKLEDKVIDNLKKGDWDSSFSDFIDSFCTYPTAFFKGPVVTTRKYITYDSGVPTTKEETCYKNQNISPLDIYPSPSASSIYDGNFIEHLRLTKKQLSDMAKLDSSTGYRSDHIIDILESFPTGSTSFVDTNIEESKSLAEMRGNQTNASVGIYHGLHFWGSVSVQSLIDWGSDDPALSELNSWEEVEVEAILVANHIIKCLINTDPLGRRPYYSASFKERPGAIWGNGLPYLMRSTQRMCNAAARALADNMGWASGPMSAILIDRLADDGDIEGQEPGKIWQFISDPQGNGGKPIEYFDVPSNANELLAVYEKFEVKADDDTGVPRYSYGNEQVGGAGSTAKGLSILLESASKGIKSAIKNISDNVIVPRAEYQFYLYVLEMVENEEPVAYTGDVNAVVYAAEALTLKAAELELQQELLKIVGTNPVLSQTVGPVGMADILRKVFKDASFGEDVIPSRLEVKDKAKDAEKAAQQQQQAENQIADKKVQAGLEATNMQITGQERMHQETQETTRQIEAAKDARKQTDQQLEAAKIEQRDRLEAGKNATTLQKTERQVSSQEQTEDRKMAVEMNKETKGEAKE